MILHLDRLMKNIKLCGKTENKENALKHSLLIFEKDYPEVIAHLDKLMKNIKVCCKTENKVKFNLPILEILEIIDRLDKGGQRMAIQEDNLDEMEISWNRHVIYQKSLVRTENQLPYIIMNTDECVTDLYDDDDVAFSDRNTPGTRCCTQ